VLQGNLLDTASRQSLGQRFCFRHPLVKQQDPVAIPLECLTHEPLRHSLPLFRSIEQVFSLRRDRHERPCQIANVVVPGLELMGMTGVDP
jgi:hypothetical protein